MPRKQQFRSPRNNSTHLTDEENENKFKRQVASSNVCSYSYTVYCEYALNVLIAVNTSMSIHTHLHALYIMTFCAFHRAQTTHKTVN